MNPGTHATGLRVELRLPFAWLPAAKARAAHCMAGSRKLMRACNEIEAMAHEHEASPTLSRIEAKLDLMLHWLGQSLFENRPRLEETRLWLNPTGLEWEIQPASADLPETDVGWIELEPGPVLPGRLEWPARLLPAVSGRRRAEFIDLDEEMADLWTRWLFRRHRRAIQATRTGGASGAA